MKVEGEQCLLFIEPSGYTSSTPVLDDLTMKMVSALEKSKQTKNFGIIYPNGYYRAGAFTKGIHQCLCGVSSECHDFYLEDIQRATNSLAAHYLAYHREEIPQSELQIVATLPAPEKDLSTSTFIK